ncbi:Putative acetyltransferase EpsM [Stieleria neptunia]|uniref:Acetyltransferase EpsM n=1 Tax=Stieleria neptunia TaxID=2527979 RepID=A0A518HTM2_9BACT|nr:NeuD/PglB/VioB family sugar acetyltransferase [Stieleria neptunia]QDV44210.1 Putative acetyltransferase EpsM [Stieleria neptunia]
MKPLVLIGCGGHCRSCIDVVEATGDYQITSIVGQQHEVGQQLLGYRVDSTDRDLQALVKRDGNFLVAIGQIETNAIRVKLYNETARLGGAFPTIVSPLAHVSKHAVVGRGTIVMHHAIVNASASIGENCIINSKSLIEHDVEVGNHCHVATGAIVNGGTTIGDDCFIGSGTVVKQSIQIEPGMVIGAGQWIDGRGGIRVRKTNR